MRKLFFAVAALLLAGSPALAQFDSNSAMNAPDQVAWQLFLYVNADAGGGNATFETWINDTDTFKPDPVWPAMAKPLSLHPPILSLISRQEAQARGVTLPAAPTNGDSLEETRRNKPTFDFIFKHGLFKRSGLKSNFGQVLSFPKGPQLGDGPDDLSVEVKANWDPVEDIPNFTKGAVKLSDVPKFFHVNKGGDGKMYALVSLHVISKLVPNWTWATFESRFNPGRCDIIGCKDAFGAAQSYVPPAATPNGEYTDCVKTAALLALIAKAKLDPVFANYCLKGSQADLTDNTGLATRVGNSVTEQGFVDSSSCMSCHGRSSWDKTGANLSIFIGNKPDGNPIGSLGPIDPAWYWSFSANPPIYQGMPGLAQLRTSGDFVWSVGLCAYDDTAKPSKKSRCAGK